MHAQMRPVPRSCEESFSVLHLAAGPFRPLWHTHDEFELNLIVRGAGQRRVGGSVEPFLPGEVVLVPPGVAHSWNSEGPAIETEAVVVTFPAGLFGSEGAGAPEWRAARALLGMTATAFRFDDADGAIASDIRALPATRGGARLALLFGIIDRLANAGRVPLGTVDPEPAEVGAEAAAVRLAIAALRAAGSPPRQSVMARQLGLSPSRFSRAFRRVTGTTYGGYVYRLRIERACALLQTGTTRIGTVADAAGFLNLSNFNRRFRAATGTTPRDYRKRFMHDMAAGAARP